jgi:hypothetical protein
VHRQRHEGERGKGEHPPGRRPRQSWRPVIFDMDVVGIGGIGA